MDLPLYAQITESPAGDAEDGGAEAPALIAFVAINATALGTGAPLPPSFGTAMAPSPAEQISAVPMEVCLVGAYAPEPHAARF